MDAYTEREIAVYVAELAMETGRYDDMVEAMKSVALMGVELTTKERNFLEVGYKNVIAPRRDSCRILSSIEQEEESEGNELNVGRIRDCIRKLETEMADICTGAMSLLDGYVIPASTSNEDKVFYYKMIGDHFRYRVEHKIGDDRRKLANESRLAYERATEIANTEAIPKTNPVRLSLAVNFAIFYNEILHLPQRACDIAQTALDGTVSDDEQPQQASIYLMTLLRNNLLQWELNVAGDGEAKAANNDGGEGSEKKSSSNDGSDGDMIFPMSL